LAVVGPIHTHAVVDEGDQILADAVTVPGVALNGIRKPARQQLGRAIGAREFHRLALAPCPLRRHITSYRTWTAARARAAAPKPRCAPRARPAGQRGRRAPGTREGACG